MAPQNDTAKLSIKKFFRNEKRIFLETMQQSSVTGRTFDPPPDEVAEREQSARATTYWQEEFKRNHEL